MGSTRLGRMAELTYPDRQRCKKCRGKLNSPVVSGLYCSYPCAGRPAPSTDPAAAPRSCAYTRPGDDRPRFKKRYDAESLVPAELRSRADRQVYLCDYCLGWHTGTRQVRDLTGKKTMVITGHAELGDMLRKARGGADKKVIAAKIKTRPIRITEIEEGAATIDSAVLFSLLRLYRIGLSATF